MVIVDGAEPGQRRSLPQLGAKRLWCVNSKMDAISRYRA
jgi:hypothetical protein